eukprot:COSAG01_NODE_1_length_100484_cov_170.446142_112_plen_164_part_00
MRSKKRAIYPGSFDPITQGHMDIIKRAKKQFDHIVIALFKNLDKEPLFTIEERKHMIQQSFKDDAQISVQAFDGLLADVAKRENNFTIIRGLRAVSDFEYEFQMALTNRSLDERIDTVFFMTDLKYAFLSSSTVRQIIKFGGDISAFVPSSVLKQLEEKKSNG